ncbi:MAG: hypothetical protein AB1420_15775 [Bacillota bacterium]
MPHEVLLKRKFEKELSETEGYIYAFSGKKIRAKDVELKCVRAVQLIPKALHRIAAGSVGSEGMMDNFFTVLLTNTATAGPSVEAVGSYYLYYRAIGE